MSRPGVLLYHPRAEGHTFPLAPVHVGSMLPDFKVAIVDGGVELTPEAVLAERASDAVCLGVSVLTGRPILDAVRASRAAKRRSPRLPVIWGGCHPSLLPEQCLASPWVDICVIGQGEAAFREIVLRLHAGEGLDRVAGIAYKKDGAIVRSAPRPPADVNTFPQADYRLIDLERYFKFLGARRLDYRSSQTQHLGPGLSADPITCEQQWSGLSAGRVVSEIKDSQDRFRLDRVFFKDDCFFADMTRAEAIARGLIGGRVGVGWSALGRADALRRLNREQLGLIRESGCFKVYIDGGYGPAQVSRNTRKDALSENLLETAEKLTTAGIGARFSLFAGLPGEPAAALALTYRTAKALRRINRAFETPIFFYAPYPGTEVFRGTPAHGFEVPQRLEDWEHVDLDHSIGPWISEPVRKFVPRYNFYFRYAFEPVQGGFGKRMARWFARVRVRFDFYRFDIERRLVDLSKWIRAGRPPRQQPTSREESS